jgi:UDP-3-O-[3-hydroxymyristoyl] glucosamine N-acyltransferase
VRLSELAAKLGGRLVGEGDPEVFRVAPIESAGPSDITFLANPKYFPFLETTQAAAVLTMEGIESPGKRMIWLPNPYEAFGKAVEILMVKPPRRFGTHPHATVDATAQLGENVSIGPGARIGARVTIGANSIIEANAVLYDDVSVGRDCIVHAGVVVREGCILGNRVVLQPNVTIGGDGFGFAPSEEGYKKIPQVGRVVIADDVEIGSGTTIDRGALEDTRIGKGTKIDNLVMLAHNVQVGENTILVSQVGVAGSTSIGNGCVIAGQVGIVGHLKIGNGVKIAAQSGISHDLPDGTEWGGSPAVPYRTWLRSVGVFPKLPEMRRQLAKLLKREEAKG